MTPMIALTENPGRVLGINGRYRVVGDVGTGAFGPVCVAEDLATAGRVAIRLLPMGGAPIADVLERIRGSLVPASMAHPALVRLLDAGQSDNGRPFIVMEFVEGRRLRDVLAAGSALDVQAALGLALELGGALETVHNIGLVHGAVRSSNVVILEDGRAKIMDLELADLREAQAMPTEPINEKTDIYAFATVVYEMLCGVPPFRATAPDVLGQQPTAPPMWPPERRAAVPRSVRRILEDALSEQHARRPSMPHLLNSLVLKPPATGTTSRRRTAAIGAGATVAMLFGALMTWGPLASRPSPIGEPAYTTRPAALAPPPVRPVPSAPFVRPPSTARNEAVSPAAAPSAASSRPSRSITLDRAEPLLSRATATVGQSASSSDEEYDASAVIDWLLTESARRRQ
jgi:eukaryotic-like serine/threonine-protein kinase